MGFDYDEEKDEVQEERELIGYDAYNKSEIYSDDDYVKHNGKLYHRENFLAMNLDGHGQFVDPDEE